MRIIEIKEIFDDVEYKIKYQIVIWTDDKPELKVGDCYINQKR